MSKLVRSEPSGREARPAVQACINYLGQMAERPWSDVIDRTRTNIVVDPQVVEVENGWTRNAELSLDREGFAVFRYPTAVTDFRDVAQVRSKYPREMEALVQELTGAKRVIAKELPVIRFSGEDGVLQPALLAHSDFTLASLRLQLAEQGVDLNSSDLAGCQRLAVYQTWRALSGPGQDKPLALADQRTVAVQDRVVAGYNEYQSKLAGGNCASHEGGPEYEFCLFHQGQDHRWYFFPQLESEDLIVWKGFEVDDDKVLAMHTAFADPEEHEAPPRASVEARVYAFF